MKGLNVLSLFDGMSCMQIALRELNIPVANYFASEVDKHAIAQTQLNFPNTVQLGDVRSVDVSKLPYIHVLAGGSPCQSFSFAGKRNGMTTRENVEIYTLEHYLQLKNAGFEFEGQSYLFWEYMRILKDIKAYNPSVFFLLENVEMGAKWERVLSEAIGIYGVHINSALVSAQNRKRIYWTNFRTKRVGLFGELHSDIPQPADRGILLKDILESEVDEKYYLSDKMLSYFNNRAANFNNGKVNVRDASAKSTTLTASMASCDISDNFILDTKFTPKQNQDKSNCFTAGGNSGGLHSDMDLICVGMRGREVTCLTPKRFEHGKSGTLDLKSESRQKVLLNDSRIRRLTPLECARLQTIPTWYKWGCSDTQAYRMLGNGWTVEVIKHILSFADFNNITQ